MATVPSTSRSTPLTTLQSLGQSVWIDMMSRRFLNTGELRHLVEADGLQGVTSNPTIFEKAIAQSRDYDAAIAELLEVGADDQAIYQELTVTDIRDALDLFSETYRRTEGLDGYVSLEVSPLLAHETAGTIAEAKTLWRILDRPNAMIKVPGTPEGAPAIEELLFEGLNINVTLLFSVEAYEAVARAYIRALQRRVDAGRPVDGIASVASFFVSRIDSEVDARIDKAIAATADPAKKTALEALKGQIAIANAKNAYALYQQLFEGPEFAPLKAKGARVQRLLWASVGTKNPKYPDTLYIDELIGPETVSTMPPATYDAFKDHGHASVTITQNQPEAAEQVRQLESLGISLGEVTDLLLKQGVESFAKSFDQLMGAISSKRTTIEIRGKTGQTFLLGASTPAQVQALESFRADGVIGRMWAKDASVWKTEPEHTKIINNSLGWLDVAAKVRADAAELTAFADEIAQAGFTHVVLMGMGGSSLCPEVLRRTSIPVAGHPELLVLDSTVPATVRRIEAAVDLAKTLFVVASKSGTTTEPSVFYAYFYDRVKQLKGDKAGENFVAITDPGTLMEQNAKRDGFRRIFLNPSDIGGRYSALSYFGMVPAALMGLDIADLLHKAQAEVDRSKPGTPIDANPGAQLGAALGALALAGRDKVTLVTPAPLEAVGLWIEQLIAESTGKEGKGILPVSGETLSTPSVYGKDRVFVQVRTADRPAPEANPLLMALSDAGHPVIDQPIGGVNELGAEFYRWEIATPLAGRLLGIDPFDQPNVQESKDNTKALLKTFQETGRLPMLEVLAEYEGLTLSADPKNVEALRSQIAGDSDRARFLSVVKAHLKRVKAGDYVAITQYFDEQESRDEILQGMRTGIRDRLKVATTTGYGPRFLHSTGQFHKGGPDTGVFLQLTADDGADLPIPGEPFGFAALVQAQALGDFQSLASRGRRAVRIHLGTDVDSALGRLAAIVREALG